MKNILIFSILLSTLLYSNNQKIVISCSDAYSEMVYLNDLKSSGYTKDSLSLKIILDKKNNKYYAKSNSSTSKLKPINNSQFIETVGLGHNILYTLIDSKLTIQKSYSFLGDPVMVNIILSCKKKKRKVTVDDIFNKANSPSYKNIK